MHTVCVCASKQKDGRASVSRARIYTTTPMGMEEIAYRWLNTRRYTNLFNKFIYCHFHSVLLTINIDEFIITDIDVSSFMERFRCDHLIGTRRQHDAIANNAKRKPIRTFRS